MAMNNPHRPDSDNNNNQFSQRSVDQALDFLMDLKGRAKQAEEQNDVFMMSIYRDLVKAVSPIVTRAQARLVREDNARLNAGYKALREKFREDAGKQPRLQRD